MSAMLIRREEAPRFEVHGARVVGLASPSRGSPSLATWRLVLAAGASSPLHSLSVDEVFVVLRGAAVFHVGGEVLRACEGDALVVPAGTEFRFVVEGDSEFEAMATVPAGCTARVEGGERFAPPWAV